MDPKSNIPASVSTCDRIGMSGHIPVKHLANSNASRYRWHFRRIQRNVRERGADSSWRISFSHSMFRMLPQCHTFPQSPDDLPLVPDRNASSVRGRWESGDGGDQEKRQERGDRMPRSLPGNIWICQMRGRDTIARRFFSDPQARGYSSFVSGSQPQAA